MDSTVHTNSYKKAILILQSIQASIGLIGIVCNMLTFAIFIRRPLRTHSYAFYFCIMSWTDSIMLVHTFRHWIRTAFKIDVDLISPLFCRLIEYQPFLFGSVSFWLRILILFDRLIRVVYPAYFRIVKRKWFQFSSVFLVFTFSALIHSILPLNYRLKTIENSTNLICYLPLEIQGLNFLICLVNLAIISILTIAFNFKLLSYIHMSRKRLRNRLVLKSRQSFIKDRTFALSSIGISLTNFFLQTSFSTSGMIAFSLNLSHDLMQLVIVAGLTVTFFNFSSVFFINVFTNSIFYNSFLGLFSNRYRQSRNIFTF